MNFVLRKDYRNVAWVLIGLAYLSISGLLAHEGEMHADSAEIETERVVVERNLDQKRDSLFSLINEMYLPLKPIIAFSCFDCHSQKTEYPWYYELPLINGIIDGHIKDAQEHLDFSNDFPFPGRGNILDILREMKKEIKEGDMPLLSYRLMHWGRLIENKQQDSVFQWIDNSILLIEQFYSDENIPYQLREDD